MGGADLVADGLVELFGAQAQLGQQASPGVPAERGAVPERGGGVGEHVVAVPDAELVVLTGGAVGAAEELVAPVLSGEGAVGEEHAHGAGAAGQGGDGEAEVLEAFVFEHLGYHALVYFARGFAGDYQAGLDLAELYAVGYVEHAVLDAQAGVGDVVDGAFRAGAEQGGHGGGGGGLAVLAADAGIDEGAEV